MTMGVVGYADALSVPAGEGLTFFVSSARPTYEASLVRLIHGDRNPAGPGFKAEPVASNVEGVHEGVEQEIRTGSCAVVEATPALEGLAGFSLAFWFWPGDDRRVLQHLAARGAAGAGWSLALTAERELEFRVGDGVARLAGFTAPAKQWCFVAAAWDREAGRLMLTAHCADRPPGEPVSASVAGAAPQVSDPGGGAPLVFAARADGPGRFSEGFSGRIENPALFEGPLSAAAIDELIGGARPPSLPGLRAWWDFGLNPGSDRILDASGGGADGRLVNLPARGMRGHAWRGLEHDFRRAPDEYGAIHFHDDDLEDANWRPSLRLQTDPELRSGVYALRLRNEAGEDHVPFVVTPPRGAATADVLLLLPTLTYLAYGNEAIANRPDLKAMMEAAGIMGETPYPSQPEDRYIVANRLLSCYDIHSDGSGVCYSSARRPLLNMRPGYYMPLLGLQVRPGGASHLLPADLYMADWLEAKGFRFDVATDHDLDREGAALLRRYKVVITGSHPEYHTRRTMDATRDYLEGGGRLMYAGGNGYCWVTSFTANGKAIETRRMRSMRPWTSHPAEERHSTTGEQGGLWADSGRPSHAMVGVGTSCVGYTGGVGYRATPQAADPRASFILAGVEDEEIGAFPNLVYGEGAAGWEVDRAEPALGTPAHAVVVATARLADDSYQQVIHELEAPGPHTGGTVNPACRADMTYLEYPNGGAVWTPGSVLWNGALSYDGYRNNVSRVTENVLRRFLS